MELESLKDIWQRQELPRVKEPSREEWGALLQKKSVGPVARMRRNLRKEFLVLFISYLPVVVWYLVDFNGRLAAVSWAYLGLLIFFGIYYYSKDRLLKQMLCVSCEVRSNLQRQLTTLRKFLRFYLYAGTLMVPFVFLFVYFLIRRQYPAKGFRLLYSFGPANTWTSPFLWLVLLILLTIGLYFLNTWSVNKLYGRHIKKLQELLQEMDAE